jgi:hypothetical protein
VIPIEKSLLYVQPLFLAADKAGLPELKRVIVAFGMRWSWRKTWSRPCRGFSMGKKPPLLPAMAASADAEALPATLAREAMSIYERAVNLQRPGELGAAYGEELRKLEQVLKRMAK